MRIPPADFNAAVVNPAAMRDYGPDEISGAPDQPPRVASFFIIYQQARTRVLVCIQTMVESHQINKGREPA